VAQQIFNGDGAMDRLKRQRRLFRFSTPTFTSAKAGMYFETGSSSLSLPSSTSIIAATLVMGFDIEYRRKIASGVIGNWVTTSRTPKFSKYTGVPCCSISKMAPGILPVAISLRR
jgi:hypothetical protein